MPCGFRHGKSFDSSIRGKCGAGFFHLEAIRLRFHKQG
jgi:hypothetical protein